MLHTFAKQATEKQTLCHSIFHQHDQQAQTISSNAKGQRKDKNGHILQSNLQTLLCTRTLFCMHHLKQGGLGRTRWLKMHTNNFSPGSPQNGSWFYGRSYFEPSRDTHGYWPQGHFTVSKGRTFKGSRTQQGNGRSWRINTSNANMHKDLFETSNCFLLQGQ